MRRDDVISVTERAGVTWGDGRPDTEERSAQDDDWVDRESGSVA